MAVLIRDYRAPLTSKDAGAERGILALELCGTPMEATRVLTAWDQFKSEREPAKKLTQVAVADIY